MPDPSLDRAVVVLGELATTVRSFTAEARELERLRSKKIRALYTTLFVLVPAIALLIVLAITNFALLSKVKDTAADSKSTNTLLLGCFTPGSKCAEVSKQQQEVREQRNRQATYVMLYCLRLNPLEKDPNAIGVQRCVQQFYPGFVLPPRATPTRTP